MNYKQKLNEQKMYKIMLTNRDLDTYLRIPEGKYYFILKNLVTGKVICVTVDEYLKSYREAMKFLRNEKIHTRLPEIGDHIIIYTKVPSTWYDTKWEIVDFAK